MKNLNIYVEYQARGSPNKHGLIWCSERHPKNLWYLTYNLTKVVSYPIIQTNVFSEYFIFQLSSLKWKMTNGHINIENEFLKKITEDSVLRMNDYLCTNIIVWEPLEWVLQNMNGYIHRCVINMHSQICIHRWRKNIDQGCIYSTLISLELFNIQWQRRTLYRERERLRDVEKERNSIDAFAITTPDYSNLLNSFIL